MKEIENINFEEYLRKLVPIQISGIKNSYKCEECKDSGFRLESDGVRPCECSIKKPSKHPLSFHFEIEPIVFESAKKIRDKEIKLTVEQFECLKFCADFLQGNQFKAPYLHARRTGTGKTILISYLGIRATQIKNLKTQFITSVDLKNKILEAYNLDRPAESVLNAIKYGTDLLIIDDLGAEKLTESFEEHLYNVLDYRLNARKQTAFTSNYRIDELPYSPRIRSRIHGLAKEFELSGMDQRREA